MDGQLFGWLMIGILVVMFIVSTAMHVYAWLF